MVNRSLSTSLRCLAHPATLLSIVLLLLNDHLLKSVAPSLLTGKLSDFAGLFFFPFLLAATLSLVLWPLVHWRPGTIGRIAFAAAALAFVLLKATPWGNAWATDVLSAIVGHPVSMLLDPTDLIALAMLWPAWRLWQQMADRAVVAGRPVRAGWVALVLAAAAGIASGTPAIPGPVEVVEVEVPPVSPLPPPITMTVIGHLDSLASGSEASMQLLIRNPATNENVTNARVTVTLGTPDRAGQEVFRGQTDEDGLLTVRFPVPEQVDRPDQMLSVVADAPQGSAHFQAGVYVGQVYNVLVSTDKPVYQPGQVIHLRALALDNVALKAADEQPVVLTVQDPQGNRIMRRELLTSRYGVASTDFMLDSQAAGGDYAITAELGPVTSSRSVEVKPYRLPRFKINFESDQPFYLPGETASGTVDAQYFFGKPVAGGQVRIAGFVTDVGRNQAFELSGETDADGVYRYQFPLPDALVAQVEGNTAKVDLEITVIDTANHSETVTESITVAREPLLLEAVPESGVLRPGVENLIYLQASYPDGRAAEVELTIGIGQDWRQTVRTDPFGLATIAVTPPVAGQDVILEIQAVDEEGRRVQQRVPLGTTREATAVLLRPAKTEYRIGETLNVDAYVAGHASTVFLDIVKEGQTFGLAALPVSDGRAGASIPLDGSLLGTLELHGYVITDWGEIVRDRRLVLVNPAPAQVDIEADADVYRPGDTARLTIGTSHDGLPMPGVLGISIVDESVFSVGAQDPGFARTYFLLERELLEPRYEIHDFAPLGDESSPYDREYQSWRQTSYLDDARQVALAGALAQELAWDHAHALSRDQAGMVQAAQEPEVLGHEASPFTGRSPGGVAGTLLLIPVAGLALFDDRRRLRHVLIGLALAGTIATLAVSCAAPAAPLPAPAEAPAAPQPAEEAAPAEPAYEPAPEVIVEVAEPQPPRLRQFFPETLYWLPELETDADGRATVEVPIADSITTWRVSVLASDEQGNLGSAEAGLRVFQDFFVEPDLPRFLTQGDEIAVPVSIYNYLDEPQQIRLEVADAGWFEFYEAPQLTVQLAANEVAAAYIPIRVTGFGLRDFEVTAFGSQMSDAVLRQVEILPDGRPVAVSDGGPLRDEEAVEVLVPPQAVPGTARITVKILPGVVSQVVEGLDGLLQQPYGCFEQTSSTTYPNVLVLDYLKTTGQASPQVQLRAEEYVNLGYQRLLTFEVANEPGGFSLFGDPPAWTMLTAYGLMEFGDMSRVAYVDPALLQRTADYLIRRQNSDGSWNAEGMTVESGWERLGDSRLPVTAYIAWALADAGYGDYEPVRRALQYVRANTDPAMDPYALAIAANALVAVDPRDPLAGSLLDSLVARAEFTEDGLAFWRSDLPTYMGGYGDVASVETTAMIAHALLRAGYHLDVAQQALDFLVSQRDSFGAFHTTQATILSLKALLLGAQVGGEGGSASVAIQLDDGRAETMTIGDANADVVQQVRFDDLAVGRPYLVTLRKQGDRALQYQVIAEYTMPWTAVEPTPAGQQALRVDVAYDRTELAVNDTVGVMAEVELLVPGQAGMVLVDLGVPPGFSPVTEDLDALVQRGAVDRYELTGRQILLYLSDVATDQVHRFDYRLRARFPVKAQTPSSQAYDYYTPDRKDVVEPQRVQVRLGTGG